MIKVETLYYIEQTHSTHVVLKSKYGKDVLQIEDIKNDSDIVGVHLWSSFIRKHNINGHSTNSFMAFLCK